jgi:hypothetical protein
VKLATSTIRCLISCTLLCFATFGWAQELETEVNSSPSLFLVVVQPTGTKEDASYASIVREFLLTKMESAGFSAELFDGEIDSAAFSVDVVASLPAALDPEHDEDFAIGFFFNRSDENVVIDFTCVDLINTTTVFSAIGIKAKTLLIDITISFLVSELADKLADVPGYTPLPVTESSPSNTTNTVSTTVQGAATPGTSNVGQSTLSSAFRGSQSPFHFGLGFGVFLSMGYSTDFFTYGLTPTAEIGYSIPFSTGSLGFGIHVNASFIEVDNANVSSNVILAPFAATASYTSTSGSFLDMYVAFNGGGSIVSAQITSQEPLLKTTFYISAIVGAMVRVSELFSLRISIGPMVIFEQRYPIFGYTPSISIVF